MIWGLIWIIALYIILIPNLTYYLLEKVSKDSIRNIVLSFLISTIAFITFTFLNMSYREYEYQYTQDIVAIQDSETMITSRYSADSEMYYYFMVENGDSYRSRKASQNKSTIKFTDKQPRLEVYKKESTNKFVYFFMPVPEYVDDYSYTLHVPKGTIKEEFKIDLN